MILTYSETKQINKKPPSNNKSSARNVTSKELKEPKETEKKDDKVIDNIISVWLDKLEKLKSGEKVDTEKLINEYDHGYTLSKEHEFSTLVQENKSV